MLICLLLIISCGGGGGSSSSGGSSGGGDNNNNPSVDLLSQLQWSITPFSTGFSVQWHNLDNFNQPGVPEYLNITLIDTNSSLVTVHIIPIADLVNSTYRFTNLTDGNTYNFGSKLVLGYTNNDTREVPFVWLWDNNREDYDTEGGILVGPNYDGDARADTVDVDDDNDGVNDRLNGTILDFCPKGALDWQSNNMTDFDGDGCRDASPEDTDDDNDGLTDAADVAAGCQRNKDCDGDSIEDGADMCVNGDENWTSNDMTDSDGDGCRDDSPEDTDDDNDGLTDTAEVAGCQFESDCDDDGIKDGADMCVNGDKDWQSNNMTDFDGDGCRDDSLEDTDDDNDDIEDGADDCPRNGEKDWQSNATTDYDGDGCRDNSLEDTDDDNDGIEDDVDGCPRNGEKDWQSVDTTDYDGDGCQDDSLEDTDDDNDDIEDGADDCPRNGEKDWQSNATTDYDGDGCRDDSSEDTDDDNDDIEDGADDCPRNGEKDWQSNATTDYDGDGCRDDSSEDTDDDNDNIGDSADRCAKGETDWQSNNTNDVDRDGCRNDEDDDDDNDELLDTDEMAGCILNPDCDGDDEMDGDDVDIDGDGLIEIATAEELDKIRYQLNGNGSRQSEMDDLDTTGCGDGEDTTACNGYELIRDISLAKYIADNDPIKGWQPIAHDINTESSNLVCDGPRFTGIFDGNGFIISNLFINQSGGRVSDGHCIGLFGRADGIFRNLGIIADTISGRQSIGGLVGDGQDAEISRVFVVSHSITGEWDEVGGIVGDGTDIHIVQSYAVSGSISGRASLGGLVGTALDSRVVQSYAVSGSVSGSLSSDGTNVAGLIGFGQNAHSYQSYAVTGLIAGNEAFLGGLIAAGADGHGSTYWDTQTSERTSFGVGGTNMVGHNTAALRSPTTFTGIYDGWDDGAIGAGTKVAGVDRDGTKWCDEDSSGSIESDEERDNNRVWDLGSNTEYPALRCTPDSLTDQRAWWSLDTTTNKPVLNADHLNQWLDGTLP